jgi:hypothetical protein
MTREAEVTPVFGGAVRGVVQAKTYTAMIRIFRGGRYFH